MVISCEWPNHPLTKKHKWIEICDLQEVIMYKLWRFSQICAANFLLSTRWYVNHLDLSSIPCLALSNNVDMIETSCGCLQFFWSRNSLVHDWLVVWTPLKNIRQLGWLFPIYGKIKNVPNHQPDDYFWNRKKCRTRWIHHSIWPSGRRSWTSRPVILIFFGRENDATKSDTNQNAVKSTQKHHDQYN